MRLRIRSCVKLCTFKCALLKYFLCAKLQHSSALCALFGVQFIARHCCIFFTHRLTRRKRKALVITDTELKLIAAAAIIGESSNPNIG